MTSGKHPLETSESVRRILSIEDDAPGVLFEPLPGSDLPLWPRVRMYVANALTATELGVTSVTSAPSRWKSYRRLARAWLPSKDDASIFPESRDFLFIASGVTSSSVHGVERNWLVGDYLNLLGKNALLTQWAPRRRGTTPEFTPTRSLDAMNARLDLLSYRRNLPDQHLRAIESLVLEYATLFGDAVSAHQTAKIIASVRYQERRAPILREQFARLLERVRPHTVVLEDASYGHRGDLISLMKQCDIHVAEPQHGWIGPSHAAYNFGASFEDPAMRRQLPDELLTFGDYWSRGLRHPGALTPIGKPHLERSVRYAPLVEDRPKVVLVASSIADPDETARFVLSLRDLLPEWTVRFRPHPSERASLTTRYSSLTDAARVEFDRNEDLYVSFRDCRAVVGVASTVLFEAASFGCDVLVRESPFADYYVGDIFGPRYRDQDGLGAIASRIDTGRAAQSTSQSEMWATGAEARFSDWARARG